MRISLRTIAAGAAVAAGAMLNGCAATHVGDDWQCPLIQGVPCQRVADADPAGVGARQRADAQQGDGAGGGTVRSRAVVEEGSDPCDRGCRPSARTRRGLAGGNGFAAGKGLAGGNMRTGSNVPAAEAAPEEGPRLQWAGTGSGVTDEGELRTPEVIGRIWIAPYVDEGGVYREASWVRVVLHPARWRLP